MIWPPLFFLVAFIAISWSFHENRDRFFFDEKKRVHRDGGDWVAHIFASFLAGLVGLLPAFVLAGFFGDTHIEEGYVQIQALKDNTHIEGDFYLFGGSIDSEPVYSYYYEGQRGTKMGWVPAIDSYIVEEETDNPRLVIEKERGQNTWWHLDLGEIGKTYIFYVPPGSITQEIELDLE